MTAETTMSYAYVRLAAKTEPLGNSMQHGVGVEKSSFDATP